MKKTKKKKKKKKEGSLSARIGRIASLPVTLLLRTTDNAIMVMDYIQNINAERKYVVKWKFIHYISFSKLIIWV